eukprot:3348956-Rhodomonas_salina.1
MRGYLNERSVLAIFAEQPRGVGAHVARGKCQEMANKFRISRKTVRDIWNRKSWVHITAPFCAGTSNLPLPHSDSDRESSPSLLDPFVHVADVKPHLQAAFTQQAAAPTDDCDNASFLNDIEESAFLSHETASFLSDIEESAFSSHQDPYGKEWETAFSHIDLATMGAAHDIETLGEQWRAACSHVHDDPSFQGSQCQTSSPAEAPTGSLVQPFYAEASMSAWQGENSLAIEATTDLQAAGQGHWDVVAAENAHFDGIALSNLALR